MQDPVRHLLQSTATAFTRPALALALCAGVWCFPAAGQTLSLEDRLAAIRSSLVQASLE